jgi:hypothetical protein
LLQLYLLSRPETKASSMRDMKISIEVVSDMTAAFVKAAVGYAGKGSTRWLSREW